MNGYPGNLNPHRQSKKNRIKSCEVTFDNSERLWCNCEVTWQNGDVFVIDAGEMRTYEFYRGSQTFDAYCGNDAFGNSLCGLEEGTITRSFDIDCSDEHVMNLNF